MPCSESMANCSHSEANSRSPSGRTVRRVSDSEKIKNTWEKMRNQERADRDERIKEDLEQTERISKTLAGEDDSAD